MWRRVDEREEDAETGARREAKETLNSGNRGSGGQGPTAGDSPRSSPDAAFGKEDRPHNAFHHQELVQAIATTTISVGPLTAAAHYGGQGRSVRLACSRGRT